MLTDIEGTTTRISFVKDVLFPFAYKKLDSFFSKNAEQELVAKILAKFDSTYEAVKHFQDLIEKDVKDPDLKSLQGLIWKEGYDSGELVAHLYPDVLPVWKKWKEQGIDLGIYSSGSVPAQKLLFGHTEYGDLNPMISRYFDLNVGKKFEANSYQAILSELGLKGSEVIFLSDIEAELDAAAGHEIKTYRLFREVPLEASKHESITSFEQVSIGR